MERDPPEALPAGARGAGATVRPTVAADAPWVERYTETHWGAPFVVAHGEVLWPHRLPGFVAEAEGDPVGLLTYRIGGAAAEVVTLDSDRPGGGVGSALLEAVAARARVAGCARLWLVTTNDNLTALGFYQRRGFRLAALHRDAVALSRRLKPQIPRLGEGGIPLRDELELELLL